MAGPLCEIRPQGAGQQAVLVLSAARDGPQPHERGANTPRMPRQRPRRPTAQIGCGSHRLSNVQDAKYD
jgi:hypothetical protein